jgi:hypothetical protein
MARVAVITPAKLAQLNAHVRRLEHLLGARSRSRVAVGAAPFAMQRFVGQKRSAAAGRAEHDLEQPPPKRVCHYDHSCADDSVTTDFFTESESESESESECSTAVSSSVSGSAGEQRALPMLRRAPAFRVARKYSNKGELYRSVKAAADGALWNKSRAPRKAAIVARAVCIKRSRMDRRRPRTLGSSKRRFKKSATHALAARERMTPLELRDVNLEPEQRSAVVASRPLEPPLPSVSFPFNTIFGGTLQ